MKEFSRSKNFRRLSLSALYSVLVCGGVFFGFNFAFAGPPMPLCGTECMSEPSFGTCDNCCTQQCHIPNGPEDGDKCDIWCDWKWNS